jgi:hypothetical protein
MLVVATIFSRCALLVFSVLLLTAVADDGAKIGSTSTHNDPQLSIRNPSQAIFLSGQDYNNPTSILLSAAIPAFVYSYHESINFLA